MSIVYFRFGEENSLLLTFNMIVPRKVSPEATIRSNVPALMPPAVNRKRTDITPPPHYNVVMMHDAYTTDEFLQWLLCKHFNKSADEAACLTTQVRQVGAAVAGTYPHQIAEMKVRRSDDAALEHGFHLMTKIEPAQSL